MSDGKLTFSEAMALDPSEVETYHHGTGKWVSMETAQLQTVATMRKCEYRRAGSGWEFPKPKRSRVQEMVSTAKRPQPDGWGTQQLAFAHGAEEAIRAVCEYLSTTEAGHMVNHDLPGQVEREFLEPR